MKCRACKQSFTKLRPMQIACSPTCAYVIGKRAGDRARAREARKQAQELRKRKEAAKPRSQWMREAQTAVNAWIRWRDRAEPCISCRREHQGQIHAGHYLSTGARPELRFDEANIHAQCAPCNTYLSGNLVLFRLNLIAKIGLAEVERLEGLQVPKKYTIDELKAIRDDYRSRLKVCLGAGVSGAVS